MWEISKEIGMDYGHRVHNQSLNKEYSMDDDCVCKHLHGHRGTIQVFLSGDELEKGMVTDFKHLNWFQKFIDDNIDHKFIIDRNDPWFDNIINGKISTEQYVVEVSPGQMSGQDVEVLKINNERRLKLVPVFVPGTEMLTGYNIDVSELSGPEKEFYEGFFIVDFVPTSENLCKWAYDATSVKMEKIGVNVSKILWQETPKSRAVYAE
jgi:6-pyruvoyltetrahydropterin/6-carboxytetrahydropterin synthase